MRTLLFIGSGSIIGESDTFGHQPLYEAIVFESKSGRLITIEKA